VRPKAREFLGTLCHNKSRRVRLRFASLGDLNSLLDATQASGLHLETYVPYPYTRKNASEWLEKQVEQPTSLVLEDRARSDILGVVSFLDLDFGRRNSQIAYWLRADRRREGLMTEVLSSILPTAFQHGDLKKLYARVFDSNVPSILLLKSLGFRREGLLRQHEWHNGRMRNVVLLGLSND
jgi:ribosomal-protein-alanine N-acetyltransferase